MVVVGTAIGWAVVQKQREKLPPWLPYRRFASLCIVLMIGGGVLATWQFFFHYALRIGRP